jgi:hypothetical protein
MGLSQLLFDGGMGELVDFGSGTTKSSVRRARRPMLMTFYLARSDRIFLLVSFHKKFFDGGRVGRGKNPKSTGTEKAQWEGFLIFFLYHEYLALA